jgi:preprotein translocase subunit Sss1
MFAAAIKLAKRPDRFENKHAVLIPGGMPGVWLISSLGFLIVLVGIIVSLVPPGDSADKFGFEVKLVGGTMVALALGLFLYYRGVWTKKAETRA